MAAQPELAVGRCVEGSLPGPSRTITIEPIRVPAVAPADPRPAPAPGERREPDPAPEPVPAR